MAQKCGEDNVNDVMISSSVKNKLENGSKDSTKAQREKDESWYKKIKSMEDDHTKKQRLTKAEFEEVITTTECQLATAMMGNPCHDKIRTVIECYQDYEHQSLNCANAVEDFVECVDRKKKEMETAAKNKNKINELV